LSVNEQVAAERVERFSRELRSHGFRLTHQRLEVVREVASTDAHPDADSVFQLVRARVPTISLDTVYRTLGTLTDLGLIVRVSGVGGGARYDANEVKHHHFICTRCGMVGDVEIGESDDLNVPASVSELGEVYSIEARFRGVCRGCAEVNRP
jgi:Fur family transcriptional regulator, peroxide stress response regulator